MVLRTTTQAGARRKSLSRADAHGNRRRPIAGLYSARPHSPNSAILSAFRLVSAEIGALRHGQQALCRLSKHNISPEALNKLCGVGPSREVRTCLVSVSINRAEAEKPSATT